MKLDQFRIDHFRSEDTIDVQCLWLQQQLREMDAYKQQVGALERRVQGLMHKTDRLESQLALASFSVELHRKLDERV